MGAMVNTGRSCYESKAETVEQLQEKDAASC